MKAKIAFVLCLIFVTLIGVGLSVSAEPTTTAPSDLTGYTITVPYGWTASAGVGEFDITGSFTDINISGDPQDGLSRLAIGYLRQNYSYAEPTANYISYAIGGRYSGFIDPTLGFSFVVSGGSDVSNSTLISWLVDNNATFDNGSSPEPDPELFPVAGGFYAYDIKPSQMPTVDSSLEGTTLVYPVPAGSKLYLNEAYNVNRGTEIPIQGIVIQFANITNSNNYHIKVGVWYSDDAGFVPENVFTIVCTEGTLTKVNRFSFSRFYLSESVEFDEWGYQFFNAVFVPSDQPVPIFDGSPIAYIISSINDALRTDIFGTYSIMDMVTIFVSISLLIWVLKMLAGG